jgi:putative membrane protein
MDVPVVASLNQFSAKIFSNGGMLRSFRTAQIAEDWCMPAEDLNRDPRVYFAAERTFLAWIRTSLALMAFGFVVSRFGLFLRVLESSSGQRISEPSTLSLPLGVFLVLLGVIVDIFAAWRHVRYVRAIDQGLPSTGRLSTLAVAVAVILAVLGLVMAFYVGTATKSHQGLSNTLNKSHISIRVAA